ncbi:MAG: SDR family oxidoreductase [Halieaceae bacterium]|nr:SDR family oxidoreductase [Halieaceae bacterium]
MSRLEDKIAIVTGAGQGIGRAIATTLSKHGATVVAVDLNLVSVQETVAGFSTAGLALACNVGNSAEVTAVVAAASERFGKIDILINNAGIGMAPNDGSDVFQQRMAQRAAQFAAGETPTVYADHTIDMQDEGWLAVMNVNINGTFYFCREVLKVMSAQNRSGSIVNISSTSALNGEGGAHYCASKAATLGLTKALAQELGARGIRVNAVAPGPTDTPAMAGISQEWRTQIAQAVLLNRLADPAEIANAVLYLASDESSYVTGHTLCANGGMHLL